VVAKSLLWPGAYAVACGKRFTNIYVGTAVKYSPTPYEVPMPPALQSEWAPPGEDGETDPAEGGEASHLPLPGLLEQPDILIDPTPPAEEEPAEEE
jgi:Radial spokehead-like protein